MKCENYVKLSFPALSRNESYARAAVGAFVSQLDPTVDELGSVKAAVSEAVTRRRRRSIMAGSGKCGDNGSFVAGHRK